MGDNCLVVFFIPTMFTFYTIHSLISHFPMYVDFNTRKAGEDEVRRMRDENVVSTVICLGFDFI